MLNLRSVQGFSFMEILKSLTAERFEVNSDSCSAVSCKIFTQLHN